jgi:hypothetical protein
VRQGASMIINTLGVVNYTISNTTLVKSAANHLMIKITIKLFFQYITIKKTIMKKRVFSVIVLVISTVAVNAMGVMSPPTAPPAGNPVVRLFHAIGDMVASIFS